MENPKRHGTGRSPTVFRGWMTLEEHPFNPATIDKKDPYTIIGQCCLYNSIFPVFVYRIGRILFTNKPDIRVIHSKIRNCFSGRLNVTPGYRTRVKPGGSITCIRQSIGGNGKCAAIRTGCRDGCSGCPGQGSSGKILLNTAGKDENNPKKQKKKEGD